ncbi:MAG TPA: M43 family zinc metalloprotease [Brumimicrobium sp.]|nr:M43 family zinc metalloprotease [Brumimicrobium sp.]
MLKTLFPLISLTLAFTLFGQNSDGIQKCGQFEALEKMRIEDPIRYQIYQQSRTESEQETGSSYQKSGTIYTIPVVFHVLHNNGPENISDAQIHDALAILNEDFRKLNTDVNSVYHTFLPITSDSKIEFEFATIAPNGLCFDGITRTVSSETTNGSNGLAQVNAIVNGNDIYQGVWPHHKYLNIYICEDLGTAAGYTYKPNGVASVDIQDMRYNSIFMRYDYVGSFGTSASFASRTLTHEVGHWLNLSHVWGDIPFQQDCSGDDFVADTPETAGFRPCPSSPNDAKICNPPIVENYENYMDYSFCSKMFTQGQSARMRDAIVSYIGGRDNIWTTTNLEEVGVIGVPPPLCGAYIESNTNLVCEGSTIDFSLLGVNEPVLTYSWNFPGGIPANSTQANPTVTYNTAGIYDVSLSITTASAGKLIENNSYIEVDANRTVQPLPISEGFTDALFPPLNWEVINGGHISTWERSNKGTAPTAGSSATNNFDPNGTNTMGDVDDLNTPDFSLDNLNNAKLTFDVAYRRYDEMFYDKLEVLISPECGMPYEVIYFKENTDLETESEGEGYENPMVWRNETIDLFPYIGNSEAKVKFRTISGWGNQIYIDNINIDGEIKTFNISESAACTEEPVIFTSVAVGASTWDWNFGAGASPATATGVGPHTVTYLNSGLKTTTLTIDGGAITSTETISVYSLPNVYLTSLPTPCVNHSPITLNQGNPSGGTYSGVGVTGNQFDPSTAGIGSHSINYTYSHPVSGCTNSAQKNIMVDGCLGINEENSTIFKIYPNPTSGAITVSSSALIREVVVLDNVGRIVIQSKTENKHQVELDLSHLSSGIYVVLTNVGSEMNMSKVVVE